MPAAPTWPEPGKRFVNRTTKVLWQYHCSFINTCGICLAFHGAVAASWPLPQHPACRCFLSPVFPGKPADPIDTVPDLLDRLTDAEKERAVGKSTWLLIAAGLVSWDDAVKPHRVIGLAELVAAKHLTREQLIAAGVSPAAADRAIADAAGETPEAVEAGVKVSLWEKIRRAGVVLKDAVVRGVAGLVKGAADPSGVLPYDAIEALLGVKLKRPK